ncbi:ABC transporter ATP-binding protein [Methanosphaerula palustris]|uniref:ABC transporter related n=1 Tax=Methanosphaerula palustris (strain ATCC BAA-1556 / DSM 19958 / E1-9c) TaxID=521011 RepID=B8GGT3_METPE|nr:ABC transporter ATP-binding protein [Methanosphaerula palustris]ACL16338.1 ABC transporter related [Methanosphaerula palustris E1-9c]
MKIIGAVIVAEDLLKKFGEAVAVDRISFTVQEGEVFGVLGPNGAGKTTTMRMVECISPRSGGNLSIFGMDPVKDQRQIRAMLGVVPQENNLDGELSVYDNLLMYSRFFDIPKRKAAERVEELLDFMQLKEKRDMVIETLSGGMKRRLILARALVNEPKLIVLDEPTTGLDPQARNLIWEKLHTLQREGVTILLSTHYLDEAARFCDRLIIMHHGGILVEGPPASIVSASMGSHLVETRALPVVLACLDQQDLVYDQVGEAVFISTEKPDEVTGLLLATCGPLEIAVRRPTLEDVFLKLTGRGLVD